MLSILDALTRGGRFYITTMEEHLTQGKGGWYGTKLVWTGRGVCWGTWEVSGSYYACSIQVGRNHICGWLQASSTLVLFSLRKAQYSAPVGSSSESVAWIAEGHEGRAARSLGGWEISSHNGRDEHQAVMDFKHSKDHDARGRQTPLFINQLW